MRRWFIIDALFVNALASGLVLLLLSGGGWGDAVRLSAGETKLLVVVAAAALILNLVLAPVLGFSFWARDRGTRKLEIRLAGSEAQRQDGPAVPVVVGRPPGHGPADHDRSRSAEGVGNLGET